MYISLIQRSCIIFIYYPMIIYVQFEFKQVCRFLGRKYFSLEIVNIILQNVCSPYWRGDQLFTHFTPIKEVSW
jgi:hypothetical protein